MKYSLIKRTIGFMTDMFVQSSDDNIQEDMQLSRCDFARIMSIAFSDSETEKILHRFEDMYYKEVNSDADFSDKEGEEDETYDDQFIRWFIVSWFYELSFDYNINELIQEVIQLSISEQAYNKMLEESLSVYRKAKDFYI